MCVTILKNHLQHLRSSISPASVETSWDWESGCPRTEEEKKKQQQPKLSYFSVLQETLQYLKFPSLISSFLSDSYGYMCHLATKIHEEHQV